MDDFAVKVWLASAGASFALGFGLAWYIHAPVTVDGAPAVVALAVAPLVPSQPAAPWAAPGRAAVAALPDLPANASVDQLWARSLLGPALQDHGFDAEDRLRKLAKADPVALRNLLSRYSAGQAPQERALLKSVLATVPAPDVIAFSTRLASSSNAAERKFGFELLQSVAPDAAETRSLVKRTLASEQSSDVLLQALATLQSSVADPEESQAIVAQLSTLSQHADPAVRSMSIERLGAWDKSGDGAQRLAQALTDRAPEVRQAAIFAIAQAGVRSEPAKTALIELVNNAQESRDLRGSALQALERFALSREEYARLAPARAQVAGLSPR